MKLNHIMPFFAAALLAGCAKDAPVQGSPADASKVVELSVPGDFDWKTMSEITCDFHAAYPSKVAVATGENAEPLALFFAGPDTGKIRLTIPRVLSSLVVSYETEDGLWKKTVLPVAENLTFAVPAGSRDYSDGTRADAASGVIAYPAPGRMGTLMFEDLWPGYGDYDFNDLVMNYGAELSLDGSNRVTDMCMALVVKAVGGSLPYDFYLSLAGVYGNDVGTVESISNENAATDVSVTLLNASSDTGNSAVIAVKGFRPNANRPVGSVYLNTEQGREIADEDCVRIRFRVRFRNPIPAYCLTLDTFDFFIRRTDEEGRRIEIHMGGFKPTADALADFNAISAGNVNIGHAVKPYFSNDNLVWGLHLPVEVRHAYERTDFLEAYPRFREWAQSGGILAQDWYMHGESSLLVGGNR